MKTKLIATILLMSTIWCQAQMDSAYLNGKAYPMFFSDSNHYTFTVPPPDTTLSFNIVVYMEAHTDQPVMLKAVRRQVSTWCSYKEDWWYITKGERVFIEQDRIVAAFPYDYFKMVSK